MIEECIKTHLTTKRVREIISLTFPELLDEDEQQQRKALLSVLHAGVAKFYFYQGEKKICKEELDGAIRLYGDNTLAMIQFAQLPLEEGRDTDVRKK